MSRQRIRLSFAFAAAAAAVFALPVLAEAAPAVSSVHVPISGTLTTCDGEEVNVSGDIHFVVHITESQGTAKVHNHANLSKVRGVSASGVRYRDVGALNETVDLVGTNGVYEYTLTIHESFISEDGSSNMRFKLNAHVVADANGNLRVDINTESITCTP